MRKLVVALSTLALTSACTSGGGQSSTTTTIVGSQLRAALVAYDSCDAFVDSIKTEALDRVGPYGFEGDGYLASDTMAARESGAPITTASPGGVGAAPAEDGAGNATGSDESKSVAGVDFSTTNVQEEGVDEPDIVKTDGQNMYVTMGNQLHVVDISTGTPTTRTVMNLPEASTHQLLLDGSRVLVLSSTVSTMAPAGPTVGAAESGERFITPPGTVTGQSSSPSDGTGDTDVAEPAPPAPQTTVPGGSSTTTSTQSTTTTVATPPTTEPTTTTTEAPTTTTVIPAPPPLNGRAYVNTTVVSALDFSDPAAPELVASTVVEGSLLDARMIDGVVRIVTSSTPDDPGFVYPSSSGGESRATSTNRAIIEATTADDWLPTYQVTAGPGSDDGAKRLVECGSVSHTADFAGFGMLSVSTLNLRGDAVVDPSRTTSIQSDGQNVYASSRNLYVATTTVTSDGSTSDTAIHEFDLTDQGSARYLASGVVRGYLINQFAMSELNDVLRVATTDWDDQPMVASRESAVVGPSAMPSSESFVTTFQRNGSELSQIGQVGDLGRGEQIKSVRFIGTVGYVVTFRQTDPLYTVDVSNPAVPKVVGELKIPGYSSYLHPVGNGRLVGIGQDATDQGRTTGLQISLFDVSNPATPAQVQKYTVPGGNSEAESNHHAFLWWPSENLLVIPLATYGNASIDEMGPYTSFMGAVGVTITDGGIAERGRIEHPRTGTSDPYDYDYDYDYDYGSMSSEIQRALVVDNAIMTVSGAGIATSEMANLAQRSWLPFS